MKKKLLLLGILSMFVIPINLNAAVATETTQLAVLAETAKQTETQLQQLTTQIKQYETQLMELISLPQATFDYFKETYDETLAGYKNAINQYKQQAKSIRNMTDRMKNYDYNPTNLVKTLDDTMLIADKIIRDNMKDLDEYQKILEKEAKDAENAKKDIKQITNVNQGLQLVNGSIGQITQQLARYNQKLAQQDLSTLAIKQAEKIAQKQITQAKGRLSSGFSGFVNSQQRVRARTQVKTNTSTKK